MSDGGTETAARVQRSRRYYKRFRVTPVLLGIFVLAGAAAFLLYPNRPSVYRPAPLAVEIGVVQGQPYGAGIEVDQTGPGLFGVDVSFGVKAPAPSPRTYVRGEVQLTLPAGAIAQGCSTTPNVNECSRVDEATYSFATATIDSFNYTMGRLKYSKNASIRYQGSGVWDVNFHFTVQSADLCWDANGLNLESQLPAVTVVQQAKLGDLNSTPAPGDTHVTVTYGVPDATGYDWTGGPEPYSTVNSSDSQPVGVTWIEPLSSLSAAIAVDFTDNSTVNHDNLRTFLAGAMLGIGGGALVGAIQELTLRQEEAAPETVPEPLPELCRGLCEDEEQMLHDRLQRARQSLLGLSLGDALDGSGSWGNGAAMRVAPLGAFFADDPAEAARQAALSATVTHTHPEAVWINTGPASAGGR